jgi:glutamate/aspartate transport system substrate-binding protein
MAAKFSGAARRPGTAAVIIAMALAAAPATAAEPAGTLDKVKRTGSIVMGIRESSTPLSYLDEAGKPIGYHIDICRHIVEAVKTRLALPKLDVRTLAVTSQNRIQLTVDGSIDLECGSTTNNAARQRQVAFAPTTFVASVRTAVKKGSGIGTLAQLAGKPVVTTLGSTSVQYLKARQQGIIEVYGNDHAASFQMLENNAAAAFVMDDNLLAGLIATAASPRDYDIIGAALNVEPIAIMFRRDDPAFKALVDDTVKGLMKSGEVERLYAKWFLSPIPPKNVSLDFPMSGLLASLLRYPGDDPAETFRGQE